MVAEWERTQSQKKLERRENKQGVEVMKMLLRGKENLERLHMGSALALMSKDGVLIPLASNYVASCFILSTCAWLCPREHIRLWHSNTISLRHEPIISEILKLPLVFISLWHILCEKQGKVSEACQKLQDGWLSNGDKVPPAEFAKLASEYSECPSGKKGGDLGWFPRGKTAGPFQDVAFSTEIRATSEPFKSTGDEDAYLAEAKRERKSAPAWPFSLLC
ncbi:hypothetical protein NC651_025009 [Populus alba x Populus x berolinensis]|nr:hypothetical protein NC651_025009 [Populus alba x Populus x berolinensis]